MSAPARSVIAQVRLWVPDVVVVAVCFFFAGSPGLIVGIAGQLAVRLNGPRLAAAGALVMLVVAAIATAVEPHSTDEVLFNFSKDRALAVEAARIAGVLMIVAVVGFARAERVRRVLPTSSSTADDAE